MNSELVSIIIPIYNAEKFLKKCIDSVINQTYQNLDIILIDDGSTDNSLLIANEFQNKDDRVRVLSQENRGLVATRKRGVELAKGEIVGFVDSDDWIEADTYEKLVFYMLNFKCDLVTSGIFHNYETRQEEEIFDIYSQGLYTNLKQSLYPSMLYDFEKKEMGLKCTLVNKIYRRELLYDVYRSIDTRVFYGEDALTIYQYCLKCSRVYVLRKSFYHYCIRSNSMCGNASKKLTENTYYLYNGLKRAFIENSEKVLLLKQLKQYILQLESHTLKMLYDIDTTVFANWDFSGYKKVLGRKIVIYGAGACGQAFYRELMSLGYKEDVVAWVDKDAKRKTEQCLHDILSIEEIIDLNYDYIVITIKNQEIAMKVKEELIQEFAIQDEKIIWGMPSYKELSLA